MDTDLQAVEVWGRMEITIENERVYEDPYRDVVLEGVFEGPDGAVHEWWGFYDGNSDWRIRFMPNEPGLWDYRLKFSDEATPIRSGAFEAIEGDTPGMISAFPSNPIWFGYSSGKGMLLRAFHVGDRFFADNFDAAQRIQVLDYLQDQGYNTLSIASHYLNRASPGRGDGWETPQLWPLDANEYRKMENILDELERRRLLVFPFAGFFGQKSNYPRNAEDQELYIRYTLARLGAYWNLMFNVAGPEPNGKFIVWMESEEVDRLGRLIQKLDIFDHLLSVHNETGDDEYKHASWTNYGILQGPKTIDRIRLLKVLRKNHHWAKPLFAQETLWSGNPLHAQKSGEGGKRDYSKDDIRKNALMISFTGAALCYADNDGLSSTGFSGELDLAMRRQELHDIIKGVWDFLEGEEIWKMEPAYNIATVWGAAGEGRDEIHWRASLVEDDKRMLCYFHDGGEASLELPEGVRFRGEWINAQDFNARVGAGRLKAGDKVVCPEGGDDWILKLVATQ